MLLSTSDGAGSAAPILRSCKRNLGMSRHQPTDRWRLGLALALVTTACWATLPIALKLTLEVLDPITLTWARFVFAALVTLLWLGARGRLADFSGLGRTEWALLTIASVGLLGNYLFYLFGVEDTSPGNAQLLIQAAPLLMAVGAMFVFGERYVGLQWLGLAGVVAGLVLFAAAQWQVQPRGSAYLSGSAWVLLAAVVWAVYALAQKQLLVRLSAFGILGFIFVVAAIALTPFAYPASLLQLDAPHWALLAYCSVNTLVAYGAFAAALAHWQASRVSLVLTVTPVLTLLSAMVLAAAWPGLLAAENIPLAGWAGALLVVAGSALSSFARAPRRGQALPLAPATSIPAQIPVRTG